MCSGSPEGPTSSSSAISVEEEMEHEIQSQTLKEAGSMTVVELKEELREMGELVSGTKVGSGT